ncbi:hypothetical protein NQ176_g8644 [Zarea fungicola]|uniref:Uncharacterized protein n=1 Tax=Zarea fungicola TaxID=93591 RepID=A0ACC1MT76_9HYPO|nr:hypothetical protein NQ176_g8644 [Lecanicillium fungicola]
MIASVFVLALILAAAASPAQNCPSKPSCQSPHGNLTIHSPQLYPESADFDPKRCVTYISNLFNRTISVYDAIQNHVTEVITLKGITNNPKIHVSGVQVDTRHDKLSIMANAGAAFDTSGADISGDNFLVQYDLRTKKIAWKRNLTSLSGGLYGGFQDIEHDAAGNCFVIGTFPSSIIKVSADGKTAVAWYVEGNTNQTVQGYSGVAAFDNGRNLLVIDNEYGQIFRFDTLATSGQPMPVYTGAEPMGFHFDGAYLPTLYQGTVCLISDNEMGTIVLRSRDGEWKAAEKLGVVANAYGGQGGSATATVQIGSRIYVVTEFFTDQEPGHLLNRTEFPLYDITDDVNKLLYY